MLVWEVEGLKGQLFENNLVCQVRKVGVCLSATLVTFVVAMERTV